jgi:hypothetical protein
LSYFCQIVSADPPHSKQAEKKHNGDLTSIIMPDQYRRRQGRPSAQSGFSLNEAASRCNFQEKLQVKLLTVGCSPRSNVIFMTGKDSFIYPAWFASLRKSPKPSLPVPFR